MPSNVYVNESFVDFLPAPSLVLSETVGRGRERDESMFLNTDRSRCYTYSCLLTDFKAACELVGCTASLGPHGLRVLGYNLSMEAHGENLTVAHGGWKSTAHSRYARFALSQVLSIPAGMLGTKSQFDGRRDVTRVRARRGVSAMVAPADDDGVDVGHLSDDDDTDGS